MMATLQRVKRQDPGVSRVIADACGAIRRDVSLSAVATQSGVKLTKAANEWKGCCPFHPDRSPSFTIYAGDRRFMCFGCGVGGDALDFVQRAYGVGLLDAIDRLDSGALSSLPQPEGHSQPEKDWTDAAAGIWRQGSPIAGTPAEAYLRSRGITIGAPDVLRFARLRPPKDSGVAEVNGSERLPALVALVTDLAGVGLGIQRTFLTTDGHKAASADRKVKFSLGRVRGGAIKLGHAVDTDLIVTEGLEDGLTLAQAADSAVWVAAGTSMLPAMALPASVRSVVIGADVDAPGEIAAQKAAQAFVAAGKAVRILRPTPGFKDFNAELMGVRT